MKFAKLLSYAAIAGLAVAASAQDKAAAKPSKSDAPPSLAMVFDRQIKSLENEFVSAAEAMPEDKYGFVPSNGEFKGVRTFGDQVKHVAAVNHMLWDAALGEKPPMDMQDGKGPDSITSKAEIIQFLKDSFAAGHKAANALTAKNELEMVQSPFGSGKMTRIAASTSPIGHAFDHYGQMVEYLRMNSIVPPASRPQ